MLAAALVAARFWWHPASPGAEGASLLLVTIDTLRADRVGAYGSKAGVTPFLDALAAEGVLFEQARSAVPLTLPAHATLLSGLEPPHHGVRDNGLYLFPQSHETLATRLKQRGYATAAFVGAFVLDRRFGLARGFDLYDDRIERDERRAGGLESERRAEAVVTAAEAWLREQGEPFFAWAHFYDPHAPYAAPAPFGERFADRPYEGEIAYADAQLARLVAAARTAAHGRLVVAVTADHGEGLGEHGERTHGYFIYESTLRVPLVLAGQGLPRGERQTGLARSCDLAPTLLSLLGAVPLSRSDGRDLLHGAPGREAYAETLYPRSLGIAPLFALRLGPLKLVAAPRPELYDVQQDPGETHDLAADAARRLPLERALARFLAQQTDATAPGGPEVEERLRSLGYVSGDGAADNAKLDAPDPKDALALWHRVEAAVTAEAAGRPDDARAELRAAVAMAPANAALRKLLSGLLRRTNDAEGASRVLTPEAVASSRDALVWHERALNLAAASQWDLAREADERAIALNPTLPEPHNHLGLLLARRGDSNGALLAFDAALALDPGHGHAWNNRANVLRELGRPSEAAPAYERALALLPRDPDPRNGLGALALQAGRPSEAERLFREVLTLDPTYGEARLNLAVALMSQGRADEARLEARAATRSGPSLVRERAQRLLTELGP